MRRLGYLRPLVSGLAGAVAIGAAAFGLISALLPEPSSGDRLGLRLLGVLERGRGPGAELRVNGAALTGACRPIGNDQILALSNGERFRVHGTQVYPEAEGARRLASTESLPASELVSAKADLAGSYALYAAELLRRLREGPVSVEPVEYGGRAAQRVELDDRPLVELIVDAKTLRPLAARYSSAKVQGSSVLRLPRGSRTLASAAPAGC